MSMGVKDIKGQRFGRLFVVEFVEVRAHRAHWLAKCDCGVEAVVVGAKLREGSVRSCGCLQRESARASLAKARETMVKHGASYTRLYEIWLGMRKRCLNPNAKFWSRYGGRGIGICQEWDQFARFAADMGEPPDGTSLDRIDNDKGYSKENCRWASKIEQANNCSSNRRLEHEGRSLTLAQWSRELGAGRGTISARLKRGFSVSQALATPVNTYCRKGKSA